MAVSTIHVYKIRISDIFELVVTEKTKSRKSEIHMFVQVYSWYRRKKINIQLIIQNWVYYILQKMCFSMILWSDTSSRELVSLHKRTLRSEPKI